MCLYHESRRKIKRHGRDTGKGRRLDHLTQAKLKIVARDANATHKFVGHPICKLIKANIQSVQYLLSTQGSLLFQG